MSDIEELISSVKRGQHIMLHISKLEEFTRLYNGVNPIVIRKDKETLRIRTLNVFSTKF